MTFRTVVKALAAPAALAFAVEQTCEGPSCVDDAVQLLQVQDRGGQAQALGPQFVRTQWDFPQFLQPLEEQATDEEGANDFLASLGMEGINSVDDLNTIPDIPTPETGCPEGKWEVKKEAQSANIKQTEVGWWSMGTKTPGFFAPDGYIKKHNDDLKEGGKKNEDKAKEKIDLFHKKPLLWTKMAEASAEVLAKTMYDMTRVQGMETNAVLDVPPKWQGVFWKEGTDYPEELHVFQYGVWDEDKKVLAVPTAPFTRAWAAGRPAGADKKKDKRYVSNKGNWWKGGMAAASNAITPGMATSFKEEGDHWEVQYHYAGNMNATFPMGELMMLQKGYPVPLDVVKAAERYYQEDENTWTVKQKVSILSNCVGMKDYSWKMLRIIDETGEKTKHHDKFTEYMGDTRLFTWWGVESQYDKTHEGKSYHAAAMAPTPWYAPLPWKLGFRKVFR